jgi:glycosyltransferase involved in cell wall biosynthesis
VIAADSTGQADVIDADIAHPLTRYRPMLVPNGRGGSSAVWEEPDLEEVIEALEAAYRNRDGLAAKGARAAAQMTERLSWSAAARQFHYIATKLANQAELKRLRRA